MTNKNKKLILFLIPVILILTIVSIYSQIRTAPAPVEKEDALTPTFDPGKTTKAVMSTTYGDITLELWPELAPKTVDNFLALAQKDFYNDTYFHRVIPDFMIQGGDPNTKDQDRTNDGTGGPGYKFEDECYANGAEITGEIKDEESAKVVWDKMIVPHMQNNRTPNGDIAAIVQECQSSRSFMPILKQKVDFYRDKTGYTGPLYSQILKAPVLYGYLCMANSGPNTNGSQFFIVTKKDGTPWLDGKHTVFGKVAMGMDVVHKIEGLPRDASDNPNPENQALIKSITVSQ